MKNKITNKELKVLRSQEIMNQQINSARTMKKTKWPLVLGILLVLVLAIFGLSKLPNNQASIMGEDSSSPNELLTVNQNDWVKGNKEASVVLIEYLDFECEACGAYYPLIKQLSEEYKNDVLFVSRYFPLPGHKNSLLAAMAVEAAGRQGKYWEMYNLLFERQREWGEKQSADPVMFEKYATQIALDMEKFKQDIDSVVVKSRIEKDRQSGITLGIQGTPSFFLNGNEISSPRSPEDFRTLIQAAIQKAPKNVKTD